MKERKIRRKDFFERDFYTSRWRMSRQKFSPQVCAVKSAQSIVGMRKNSGRHAWCHACDPPVAQQAFQQEKICIQNIPGQTEKHLWCFRNIVSLLSQVLQVLQSQRSLSPPCMRAPCMRSQIRLFPRDFAALEDFVPLPLLSTQHYKQENFGYIKLLAFWEHC